MTDDELIEWLLDWGRIGEEPVLIEAASRIKKLGAALREIAASAWDCNGKTCEHCRPNSCQNAFIARKALEGKDETIG